MAISLALTERLRFTSQQLKMLSFAQVRLCVTYLDPYLNIHFLDYYKLICLIPFKCFRRVCVLKISDFNFSANVKIEYTSPM